MLLKIELIYLSSCQKGQVDHEEEYYIHEDSMRMPYAFEKDLPDSIRIFFKGATVELLDYDDDVTLKINLPHRKPLILSWFDEEHENEWLLEFIKDKLVIRFKILSRFEDIFDCLSVTKGRERIMFTHEDFGSHNSTFRYPNSGEPIPWLRGYNVITFDDEKAQIINPEKGLNELLDGDRELVSVDDISFELNSNTIKINELDPITQALRVYRVDSKLFYDSFDDQESAYKIALSIEAQAPEALEIIAQYMQEAADLDSRDAKRWLSEYHKKHRKNTGKK